MVVMPHGCTKRGEESDMQLNTYHIEEIIKEGPYSSDWSSKFPSKLFVGVSLIVKSGGYTHKQNRIWEVEEWKAIKEKGYYVE